MEVFNELVKRISEEFNGILRANLYEVALKDEELFRLRKKKKSLRLALKNCGIGDVNSKNYVKSLIKDMLTEKLLINHNKINEFIEFNNPNAMTVKDKYDYLIHKYRKKYDNNAFTTLVDRYDLLHTIIDSNGFKYEITEDDINEIFKKEYIEPEYDDKVEILAQKVYESYRGLGVIDELIDMRIDGVSAGVSGREFEFNSVWIFIKGKTVHLSFLDFENEKELERVCMNIYRYNHPGQLSMNRGYIVNEMMDHSRVVVARPPFCESFVLFVRKFDTIENKKLSELIIDKNRDIVIDILMWIVKGCQICAVTGTQGCGKTTLLMSLIGYIHPAYTLRIQEMAFELHLRDIYPDRNIVTFQETDFISGQEGLDLQKKTDGTVNILGEVASAPVAAWLVQMSMVASLFTMFTHHAKTTKGLIKYMRNSLLTNAAFRNERIAEEQVIDAIRFDVHMEKDVYGHRYIERITEIVPIEDDEFNSGPLFKTVNIVEYINGKYVRMNSFSEKTSKEIMNRLTEEEKEKFSEVCFI